MVDSSLLDDIIAAATKRMQGSQRIHSGDDMPPVYRIPFDELELNLATYGGAPMGRMIRPWGGKSSCKSMIAWGLAKQAQQHRSERFPDGLTVAYYNVEGAYDPIYVKEKMGVDIEKPRLVVIEEGIIEDISRSLDSLLHAINIHIIDSASFAQSVHGFTAKKESRQPGFDAIAWKNAFRAAEENMDKRENLIVIIDQVRTDFNTGAQKAAGGNVPDHHSSLSLYHRKGKKLYRAADGTLTDTRPKSGNDELSGSHRIDGYEVEIECDKSRVCRPFGKARLEFDIDALAFNQILQLKKAGLFLDVIQQSGSYFTIPTQQKSINGHTKMDERLAVDDSLVMQIFAAADRYMREAVYG